MDRADAPSQGFAAVLAEGAFYRDPQGNAADCVDRSRVVGGAIECSGAVVVSISQRCPAADGQPPHLLTVEGVFASRLDQAVRLGSLEGVDDSLLVDRQLPRDQAQARAGGLIEIADYLKHPLNRDLGHLRPLSSALLNNP